MTLAQRTATSHTLSTMRMRTLSLALLTASAALASTVPFTSLPGATIGFVTPVKASVTFYTGDNTIAIHLANTLVTDSWDQAQSLSGLYFTLDSPLLVPAGTADADWTLTSHLYNTDQPDGPRFLHLDCLTLNGAMLDAGQSEDFFFNIAGVTTSTNVPFATFSFGAEAVNVQGISHSPEPGTLLLVILPLIGAVVLPNLIERRRAAV